jgi:hypothetical protein
MCKVVKKLSFIQEIRGKYKALARNKVGARISVKNNETFGFYWSGGFLLYGVQRDAFLALVKESFYQKRPWC